MRSCAPILDRVSAEEVGFIKLDLNNVRVSNVRTVFNCIRKQKTATRLSLSTKTGLSLPSITRVVANLSELGYVRETKIASQGPGRKTTVIEVEENAGFALGIHIDKSIIKVGIVNFSNNIVARDKIEFNCYLHSATAVFKKAACMLDALVDQNGIDPSVIIGAGIALPGIVDRNAGIQVFSPQLCWEGLPIKTIAEEIFHIPVVVDNDIKFQAYGESYKNMYDSPSSVAFLHIGSGVGAAYLQNGQVFKGSLNSAGEIGHARIDTGGVLCDCGRTGCLQTHMTEWAIVNKAREIRPEIQNSKEVFAFMEQGHSWATTIVFDLINYTALTIGLLVAVYDPDAVVLGGELVEDNPQIFEAIVNRCTDTAYRPMSKSCTIRPSTMMGDGIFYGAAVSAIDSFLGDSDFCKSAPPENPVQE